MAQIHCSCSTTWAGCDAACIGGNGMQMVSVHVNYLCPLRRHGRAGRADSMWHTRLKRLHCRMFHVTGFRDTRAAGLSGQQG